MSGAAVAPPPMGAGVLALFPLKSVLFPGGRLALKVFEARYLDLVSRCLREKRPFGVVCLNQGTEVRQPDEAVRFEAVGVLARLVKVDAEGPGQLKVLCEGGARFQVGGVRQEANGLWVSDGFRVLADDSPLPPGPALDPCALALARAMVALSARDPAMFAPTHHFDQAGWVANRWCELLPIPLAARQKLMELTDPLARLQLVDGFLRDRKVI